MDNLSIYFWSILAYLFFLIIVGAIRSRKVATQDDFIVAGRKLPTFVLVGTLLATWIGSGSIIGGAGLAYKKGLPALWFSFGAWLGMGLLFFIAEKARGLVQYTVPDILELRYNPTARVLGALVTIIA
jgi:SSS family solute:Na+ symporter/sodium/proline symporter